MLSVRKFSMIALFAFILIGFAFSPNVWAQTTGGTAADATATPPASVYAPVKLDNRKLFDVLAGSGLSAAERADKIHRRLVNLILRTNDVPAFSSQDLQEKDNQTIIQIGGDTIMTVTDADAQDALATRQDLAQRWGEKMARAVIDVRTSHSNPLTGAGILIRNSFSDLLVSVLRWIPHFAGAVVLTLIFWALARLNKRIAKFLISHARFDANLRQLFIALAFYGTWTVGMLAILSTLGLESGSIATTLGISGFVLGFAFKDILSHFFAGFMLLIGRQFHIGDQIVVKEFEGTVERIELRALYLRTYDNRLVIIPNGDVFTSIVTSNTASPHRRREFVIGIGYEADIDRAQEVAMETVRSTEGVSEDPPPDVLIDELAASTVNLRIRFYASSQRADYLRVGSRCMRRVKEAFDREHISMPTDIQTVIIQNMPEALSALSNGAFGNAMPPAPDDSDYATPGRNAAR